MKNILFSIILLFIAIAFAKAQPISTFAPVGAEWWYQGGLSSEDGNFKTSKAHQYISIEEVEYKGQLCRRLDVFEHIVDSTGAAHKTKLPDEYVYNNEDTVFCFSNKYNRFVPLYIFNVSSGDTLTFYIPGGWERFTSDTLFHLLVDSVYFSKINGESLKKIILKQVDSSIYNLEEDKVFVRYGSDPTLPSGGEYIEKLGCLKGRFISPTRIMRRNLIGFYIFPEILCYNDSSFSAVYNYKDTPVNEECLYPGKLSIDNISHLGKNLAVYPNPAREYLQLKLPDGIATPHEIKILDFTGKTVQTITSSGNHQLSIQNLPQGIYTVAVPIDGNWYYVKMMKL